MKTVTRGKDVLCVFKGVDPINIAHFNDPSNVCCYPFINFSVTYHDYLYLAQIPIFGGSTSSVCQAVQSKCLVKQRKHMNFTYYTYFHRETMKVLLSS